MRISTLLETNTTPSSDPVANQSQQAPKFGRNPHVLEDDEKLDETTAGAIATGEPTNMGVQRRGKGSMFQGIKTSKKFANSAAVTEMDKSQTPPGRDGGEQGGKEYTAKPIASKEVQDQALEKLKKILSKPENMAVLKRLKTKEGVAEAVTLDRSKNPSYPNDPATVKHRLDTAKAILSNPNSDSDSRRAAAAIIAKSNEGVAEGLPQTLRKVVPGYAKREIDKKMDDQKFGRTDVDKDANYYRYKKIQDKLKGQGVAEARPEPEQDQMDANRRAALRREREPEGSEKIDARLRQQDAQRREYEQTGKFWLKTKSEQKHIQGPFTGKASANKAALELLQQAPELKGNLVITAWGPDEQQTNEALKPNSLTALQTAKQNIAKNREQDIASWEQDFRSNFAKKRGLTTTQPQQQMQQPTGPQVSFPGEKHKDLKNRMSSLQSAIEKQKYLDYLTFKADQKGLMNPGLQADIDTSMYVKDGAKDNYQSLIQKIDKSIDVLKQRMGINKLAYKKPKVMEDELSEENLLAKDLFKKLELFKKGQDKDILNKVENKDLIQKEEVESEVLPKEYIEKAIFRVLMKAYPGVMNQYGGPIIKDAISNVARQHTGMTEITPEEATIMLHQVVSQLKTHLHMREGKQRLDPKCWTGYKKQGTKMKGDTRVNNCVKVKK